MGKRIWEVLTDQGFLGAFLQTVLLLLLGYLFRKKDWMGKDGKKAISALVWRVGIPCMAFASFMTDFDEKGFLSSIAVFLIAALFYAGAVLVSRLFLRRLGKDRAKVLSYFVALGQVTLFTMPLMQAMYAGKREALLSVNFMAIPFRITLYVFAFFAVAGLSFDKENVKTSLKKVFLSPVMIAMFSGVFIWLTQGFLPKISVAGGEYSFLRVDKTLPALYQTVDTLQRLAAPLAMFLIGFSLGDSAFSEAFRDKTAVAIALSRVLVLPVCVFALLCLTQALGVTHLAEYDLTALVLGLGAPASATLGIFCIENQREELLAARIITLSSLFSVLAVPIGMILVTLIGAI